VCAWILVAAATIDFLASLMRGIGGSTPPERSVVKMISAIARAKGRIISRAERVVSHWAARAAFLIIELSGVAHSHSLAHLRACS
jgi:hypothetical protein